MSISELRSRKSKRAKKKEMERMEGSLSQSIAVVEKSGDGNFHASVKKLTVFQRMNIFCNEKADHYILSYLDKSDQLKLSLGKFKSQFIYSTCPIIFSASQDWYSIVNSQYLFCSIVKSIGECASQVSITPQKK